MNLNININVPNSNNDENYEEMGDDISQMPKKVMSFQNEEQARRFIDDLKRNNKEQIEKLEEQLSNAYPSISNKNSDNPESVKDGGGNISDIIIDINKIITDHNIIVSNIIKNNKVTKKHKSLLNENYAKFDGSINQLHALHKRFLKNGNMNSFDMFMIYYNHKEIRNVLKNHVLLSKMNNEKIPKFITKKTTYDKDINVAYEYNKLFKKLFILLTEISESINE